MEHLPTPEKIAFGLAGCFYLAAAVVGVLQLSAQRQGCARMLIPLLSLAVCLTAITLVFRAATLEAIPLTGLFESILVLTIVLSFVYIFMSMVIPQVWFGSVMSWILLVWVVMAAVAAKPAAHPGEVAAKPWAVFHGLTMVISYALIVLAAVSAFLYLLSDYGLKHKRLTTVLGRIPNTGWLRQANRLTLQSCFVTMTIGLICGLGMAAMQAAAIEIRFVDWLVDPKFLCLVAAWILLAGILWLRAFTRFSDRAFARATLAAFLIVLIMVGVSLLNGTVHVFSAAAS